MSIFSSAAQEAAVVVALRAAGCVFAEDEARLLIAAATTSAELTDLVDRRVAGLPLEHLLGWAEFHGLRISLDPGVFVPRLRTELLVRLALDLIPPSTDPDADPVVTIVDLCCGSGAVAAALAAAVAASGHGRRLDLHAADLDPVAVRCARRNVTSGQVYQGDLFEPLPHTLRGCVDVLVANAPYVPTAAIEMMPAEARDHEPRMALDGGADGLDLQRRVAAAAPAWLAPGGHLLIETSQRQAPQLAAAFERAGLVVRSVASDELDAVVVAGLRPHAGRPGTEVESGSPESCMTC